MKLAGQEPAVSENKKPNYIDKEQMPSSPLHEAKGEASDAQKAGRRKNEIQS